mgnify:CR=1 FL=1|jgi:hypothetical protein
MLAQKLKAAFDPYFEAPIEAWGAFASLGEVVKYKKNEIIKQAPRPRSRPASEHT